MMRYTLLAADMDGTALNSQKEITPRTKRAIHQALQSGYEVMFSTGRCIAEVRPYLKDFPEMHYLISHSGATVMDLRTGEDVCVVPILPETVYQALDAAAACGAAVVFFIGNELYLDRNLRDRLGYYGCECFAPIYEKHAEWVDNMDEVLAQRIHDVRKLNFFFHTHEDWERCSAELKKRSIRHASGMASNIEVMAPTVSKGAALELLCRRIGLPIAQTIACGDEGNDVSILQAAGLGVAMGNATAQARAAADAVTADCDHDGVAEVIERYLGQPVQEITA